MSNNTVLNLPEVVGCHLLSFLHGIDAINFIEAADGSEQFGSFAKTRDIDFYYQLISVFSIYGRILLPRSSFHHLMEEMEIDEDQLILIPIRYSSMAQPFERLYIHSCFTYRGFLSLCPLYKTPFFQCYCRLLPLNTVSYYANFDLLDYEFYQGSLGLSRELNQHEKKLFDASTSVFAGEKQRGSEELFFVRSVNEFKQNLAVRFSSTLWLHAIDFSKMVLTGGCVLNALCCSPFPDTDKQNIDLFYYADNTSDFKIVVENTMNTIKKMIAADLVNAITMEQAPGIFSYNISLPGCFKLTFSMASTETFNQSLSHLLHNFDMDICQIAYTGDKIIATFPFMQALATRTFIAYSLHAESPKHVCERIDKYCNRGFNILLPVDFDGDFKSMMAQEKIPAYRIEHQRYINDDGEIRFATKQFHPVFSRNADTFRLQEKFIAMACPQLLKST